MNIIIKEIRTVAFFLSRPVLLFFAMPWLMLLLVVGTVAQRYVGLYQSQKLFFGSFILWIGLIPMPGAYATIGIIALCLCAKLLLKSPVRKHNAGIIIAHVSTLVLLLGGLVTAVSREEGYMMLGNGQTSRQVSDYHKRELAIIKNGKLLDSVADSDISSGKVITAGEMPFSVKILKYCYNCKTALRDNSGVSMRGLAAKFDIDNAVYEKEDAQNQSGVMFDINGVSAAVDGTYLTSQGLVKQPEFNIGQDNYQFIIRQAERSVPFDIRLIKFEKSEYPGTDLARSYRSEVEVIDGSLKWNTVIEMNQPLRYRGYTLYQSSFIESDGKLATVLAVVKNSGDIFPYLAVGTLCLGLIIHITITLSRKKTV